MPIIPSLAIRLLLAAALFTCGTGIAFAQAQPRPESNQSNKRPPTKGQTIVRTAVSVTESERQAMGSQFRDTLGLVRADLEAQRLEQAIARLAPVTEYCDRLLASGRALVSVATASEYQSYMASRQNSEPVDWVDMSCPQSYNILGYIAVEARDFEKALAYLDKAVSLAPLWADPRVEHGFVLNQLHRNREALADYRLALQLVERYPSNAAMKAIAQRGLGYTFVELGDLEAAERAYQDSLVAEPGNALALKELEFIRQRRGAANH